MDFIYKKELLQEKLGEKVVLTRTFSDLSPSYKYVKKNCKEFHYLANGQYTISKEDIEEKLDILTEEGMGLYKDALRRFSNGDVRGYFPSYDLLNMNSGFWENTKDDYYDPSEFDAILNSFNNISVCGALEGEESKIVTSPVVFFTKDFCLTKSGSIYKLGNKNGVSFY